MVDGDEDLVIDALEAPVCGVENSNEPYDGSCGGDDYTPPYSEFCESGGFYMATSGLVEVCITDQTGLITGPLGFGFGIKMDIGPLSLMRL